MDAELFQCFLNESLESLQDIENGLIAFEQKPEDLGVIDSIFRPVHSLKGSGAFFNLHNMSKLAHSIENILDSFRGGKLSVTQEIISVIFEGFELIQKILQRAAEGHSELEESDNFDDLLARIEAAKSQVERPEMLCSRLSTEITNLGGSLEKQDLDASKGIHSKVADLFSRLLKGMGLKIEDAKFGPPEELSKIKELLAVEIEGFMEESEVKSLADDLKKAADLFQEEPSRKEYEQMIEEFELMSSTCGMDDSLRKMISGRLDSILSEVDFKEEKEEKVPEETKKEKVDGEDSEKKAVKLERSIRVSESLIDNFFGEIGELLIINENYMFIREILKEKQSSTALNDFMRLNYAFADILKNLYTNIMGIRKGEIGTVFKKLPKIIRDVASKCGKSIDIDIQGQEVKADKSILENLESPLVHMVRNAADHGIEGPAARLEKGKKEKGSVEIVAFEDERDVRVRVTDDGKGIDFDALERKARDNNQIQGEITERNRADLLFLPGVSTAEEVTDISGRGVGLDVVYNNLKKLSGRIDIDTKKDEGTTFTISLPKKVMTQIMQGYMVRVGETVIVFPIQYVKDATYRPEQRKNLLYHDKEIINVISASEVFGIDVGDERERVSILLEYDHNCFALKVNELLDIKRVVIKDINFCGYDAYCFKGGSLLGDGRIALVADVEYLFSPQMRSLIGKEKGKAAL